MTDAARAAGLDEDQSRAAAAVASTDPLVVVQGAAGAGKTTMLGAAIDVARKHGRGARVVAPTLRAAQVARQELGVPATSVAALVHTYGWRWNSDRVWTRLTPGDLDPETGRTYDGPPRDAALARGERVIVDEAGMLDQDTAIALLTITAEARASVALVGDRAQLPAVGRGGVLDMAALISGSTFDMTGVHRFTDPAYADLTLRMRDGSNPGGVFDQLAALGLIRLHADDDAVRDHIATEADGAAAITVATNDEAAAFNERIRTERTERIERAEVDDVRTVTGSDGLTIGVGDVIQTRQNDTRLRVANRQTWIVQHIADDGTLYAKETGNDRKRQHTVALPADYVGEHVHLSYAATAYGVQGATVHTSHTILTDAISAAGVYVGMTRGRDTNQLHVVAGSPPEARAQFIDAMQRDRADRGLDHATHAAQQAVRGLTNNGPVKMVTTELARLDHEAEQAERAAQRWERIAERLDAQRATHRAENDDDADVLRTAEEHAARVPSEIAAPLKAQADADATEYLTALADEDAARTKLTTAGRLSRRRARAEHQTATKQTQMARARVRAAWGELPCNTETLTTWAAEQAARRTESDPRVIAAARAVETAKTAQKTTRERHEREHLALLITEYGAERAQRDQARATYANPHREARNAHAAAATAHREATELRSLPLHEAAARIEAKHAAEEQASRLAAERARQLHAPYQRDTNRNAPHRDRPELGR